MWKGCVFHLLRSVTLQILCLLSRYSFVDFSHQQRLSSVFVKKGENTNIYCCSGDYSYTGDVMCMLLSLDVSLLRFVHALLSLFRRPWDKISQNLPFLGYWIPMKRWGFVNARGPIGIRCLLSFQHGNEVSVPIPRGRRSGLMNLLFYLY